MHISKYLLTLSFVLAGLNCSAPAADSHYEVIHNFQENGNTGDGARPSGLMSYIGGALYGTTNEGGAFNAGTVFKIDPVTKIESVVYAFQGGADGYGPGRSLAYNNGKLYGATALGGQPPMGIYNETGTLFAIDIKTGEKRTLFEFPNDGSLGYAPGDLIYIEGLLYGTTAGGGDPQGITFNGTLFSFDPKTLVFTNLHTFEKGTTDGAFPLAGLLYNKGVLYGTTYQGGGIGAGSIFSYTISTSSFATIYSFGSVHGFPTLPRSTPIFVGGALYITSQAGGLADSNFYGYGTVFKLDLATGVGTVIYSLQNGSDGQQPYCGVLRSHGFLYGTTAVEGTYGGGALYSINLKTGEETTLHSFGEGTDASQPVAALTNVNGTFYGTTIVGGTQGVGAIYEYTPKQD